MKTARRFGLAAVLAATVVGAAAIVLHGGLDRVDSINIVAGAVRPYLTVAASDARADVKRTADYVCDGTNDEVQIQAAINALPALPGGGTIRLSEGNFYIGASININRAAEAGAGIRIVGAGVRGTMLSLAANCDMFVHSTAGSSSTFFSLEDLYLFGDRAPGGRTGRAFVTDAKLWDGRLKNVCVMQFDCTGAAVGAQAAIVLGTGWGWVMDGCVIEHCHGDGVLVLDGSGLKVMNCKIMNNTWSAIVVDTSAVQITNSEVSSGELATLGSVVDMDCDADVSGWAVGDVVRNNNAGGGAKGDHWTGKIIAMGYGGSDHCYVRLDDTYVVANVTDNLADGIENTTQEPDEQAGLDAGTARVAYDAGVRISGGNYTKVSNTSFQFYSTNDYTLGIYSESGSYGSFTGNTFSGVGQYCKGILIKGSQSSNTILGNTFYMSGTGSIPIDDNDGRNHIDRNHGYVNRTMQAYDLRYKGGWVTSTLYDYTSNGNGSAVDADVVAQGEKLYICAVTHTSGTFADDLAAKKWVELGADDSPATMTLNHGLESTNPPLYADRIYTLTPASAQFLADPCYVDSDTTTTVTLKFAGALTDDTDYKFQLRAEFNRWDEYSSAPEPPE
jgi:parallel beta-helix repeat protein